MQLPQPNPGPSKRRLLSPQQRLTVTTIVITLAALVVLLVVMVRIGAHRHRALAEASPASMGREMSDRMNALLSMADAAGRGQADPDFGDAALGRWDPFRALMVTVRPPAQEPEPEPEPEPLDLTPAPPVEPPGAVLTGVLTSDLKAIAIFEVEGQGASMAAVGDEAYPGGVVRSIAERQAVVAFMGREIKYLLGGERI